MGFFLSPEFSPVSNVEGLKLKITAHKTFKNKFDLIRAGIKFIYRENTSVIGYSVFRQTNMQRFDRQLERVLFSRCNASECIFNRENPPT